MGKSEEKAKEIIEKLTKEKKTVEEVKAMFSTEEEWYRVSNKAYNIQLEIAKFENKRNETRPHVATTPNETIGNVFVLNNTLSNYALGVPTWATQSDLNTIEKLANDLPTSEHKIIEAIERISMHPNWRARQKKGRISQYGAFKDFDKIVDAALICYYRENYISSFLTLVPVIEGILLKWIGYDNTQEKPEFEDYRKFFKQGPLRQPSPSNIQFYHVFSNVCDGIINKTLYKPTSSGNAHEDFNRHIALHLLRDSKFGTKNNCVRLFLLLDFMTEIYWLEKKIPDPRWSLHIDDVIKDIDIYGNLLVDQIVLDTAEKKLLI